jgi:hypothetical protein
MTEVIYREELPEEFDYMNEILTDSEEISTLDI